MGNLLLEVRTFKPLLLESAERPGTLIVEGLMQVAGDKNGNGRIYPKEVLIREVDKLKRTFIAQGNAFGELDHPESPVVSLKNVSHIIKDLWWEGDNVMGRVEILNTPFGNIVKEILKAGYDIGISSRGTGSLEELPDGRAIVQDDFDLVTWDFVSNPSVGKAFMRPVSGLNESQVFSKKTNKYSRIDNILREILREEE